MRCPCRRHNYPASHHPQFSARPEGPAAPPSPTFKCSHAPGIDFMDPCRPVDAGGWPGAPPLMSAAAHGDLGEFALYLAPPDDPYFNELTLPTSGRLPGEYQDLVLPLPTHDFDDTPFLETFGDAVLPSTSTAPVDASNPADTDAAPSIPAHLPPASCGGQGSGCGCLTCAPPPLGWFVSGSTSDSQPITPPAQPAEPPTLQQAATEAVAAPAVEPSAAVQQVAAAASMPPASSGAEVAAAATEAAAAGPGAKRRRRRGCAGSVSRSQRARFGFAWISRDFGTVTGWDGPTVVVRLADGRLAEVPAHCPCCGVAPYTSEDWAGGKLTKRGAPKKDDHDNPRKGEGRCPDAADLVRWLEQHAESMSDDLMEFFHLLKSTLSRLRKAAGVTNPRFHKQDEAGRGNRKNQDAPAAAAPHPKRHKRRV